MSDKATENIINIYDRRARYYDLIEGSMERWGLRSWRELLWSKVEGKKILEVGVGTGKNFPYYPKSGEMTAVDFSEKMLDRAWKKSRNQKLTVRLLRMDIQELEFDDDSFDLVTGTCVFCSVPDPVRGLREVARVVKPGGKILLIEHMIAQNRQLALLMNLVNPLVVRMMGANINRRTVDNITRSGLVVERVTNLFAGIFKLIEARKEVIP